MATVTTYRSDLAHIGRDVDMLVFDIAWAVGSGQQTADLCSVPVGAIVGPVYHQTLVAETTATNSKCNLALKTDTTVVWTGTDDNCGAVGHDYGLGTGGSAAGGDFPLSTADTLQAQLEVTGTISTTAPTSRLFIHVLRGVYER